MLAQLSNTVPSVQSTGGVHLQMTDILKWVFSVFVVSIAINIFSEYVFRWVDKRLSNISQARRKRSKEEEENRRKAVAELSGNPNMQIRWMLLDLRRWMLVGAVITMITSYLILTPLIVLVCQAHLLSKSVAVPILAVFMIFTTVAGIIALRTLQESRRNYSILMESLKSDYLL